jgi:hypothetical protein
MDYTHLLFAVACGSAPAELINEMLVFAVSSSFAQVKYCAFARESGHPARILSLINQWLRQLPLTLRGFEKWRI